MAEKIKVQTGVEAELIRSGGGVFEISINDKPIYSKKNTGEFPSDNTIIKMVQEKK